MARYLARADKPGRDNWPRYEASYHARFGGKGEIYGHASLINEHYYSYY